jgi:hypothetical protein
MYCTTSASLGVNVGIVLSSHLLSRKHSACSFPFLRRCQGMGVVL